LAWPAPFGSAAIGGLFRPGSHRRQQLAAAIIGGKFSAALATDCGTARRGRGVGWDAIRAQLRPSALWPILPAAAALAAVMQNSSSAAAAISMVRLIAKSSAEFTTSDFPKLILSHNGRVR